jgi:hypothetical protein
VNNEEYVVYEPHTPENVLCKLSRQDGNISCLFRVEGPVSWFLELLLSSTKDIEYVL